VLRELTDRTVRHLIDLQRYSNGVVRRIMAVLNRADADLFARLSQVLDSAPESATAEYLESMLMSVRALNAQTYANVGLTLQNDMQALVAVEADWLHGTYRALVPIEFSVAAVSPSVAWAAAFSRPFQGKLLKDALSELTSTKAARIRDTVRIGFLEGKTTPEIVRELRGTRAKGYADGLVELDRRHLETIVRTALSHTAATTREIFAEENEATEQLWISTLDARTSSACRLRDHHRYDSRTKVPIGHNYPWSSGPGRLHWGCRSTAILLLPGQESLFGTRASADGPVDANESYGAWLKRQPAGVHDDVLGATRGALFRRGGLEIEQFANDKGRTLSLSELAARNPRAFSRAGV
jgi:hypothetical protein